MLITLLDGYTDEPSCLGVPPYIAPYPRYIAGAIKDAGHDCQYMTIDDWRNGKELSGSLLVILAGAIVPGRYLRGMPISFNEIRAITQAFKGIKILTGASAKYGMKVGNEFIKADFLFDYVAKEDGDAFLYDFLNGNICQRRRKMDEWQRWSIKGSSIVYSHPDYPETLIAEIETYRGCVRYIKGCSFCMEPSFGKPLMRKEEDIVKEMRALNKQGVKNFRLGCQSCFFSYKAKGIGRSDVPEPNPDAIKRLLEGIKKNVDAKVLHIDNANPAVIATHIEKAREIAELIVHYCTPGNTAALGMESADENVIKMNNLNATPQQVFDAVEMINDVGKERGENGMPYLLPGINILAGLKGERKETYAKNFSFLEDILNKNLLLRRINIRQVVWLGKKRQRINKESFKRFKRKVNEYINKKMLQKIAPFGTLLSSIFLEVRIGKKVFGRQIGSYPLLVCLPYERKINEFVNVKIIDHGYRSVTGIEYPLNINKASMKAMECLPSIGIKRARRIIANRPFKRIDEIEKCVDKDVVEKISDWICL